MQHCIETYTDLFIKNVPLMDVRAPAEYERGAFPASENLPLMDDEERKAVGICYKQYGQVKAIDKGHKLVQGKVREQRLAAWINFAKRNPDGYLYCFRGGLRSQITQQWMHAAGVDFPVIQGGYKALRKILLDELDQATQRFSFALVGGMTGCGKTTLIYKLKHAIDLEGAAYHRGSSFGRHARAQNTQINFENRLAIDFLKAMHHGHEQIILEDEGRTIGRTAIPKQIFEKMRQSSIAVIEEPFALRLQRLLQEYVIEMQQEFISLYGSEIGFKAFSNYLLDSLKRIKKRLGPVRYAAIHRQMCHALQVQAKQGEIQGHYDWLITILKNYYDPMYADQLKQRQKYICFRGSQHECLAFLQQK